MHASIPSALSEEQHLPKEGERSQEGAGPVDQQHAPLPEAGSSWSGVAVLSPRVPGEALSSPRDDVLVVTMILCGWEWLYGLRWVSWPEDGPGDRVLRLCNRNGCCGS